MKGYRRIITEFASGPDDPEPNRAYTITFDAIIENNRILKNKYFGCSMEAAEKWPFTLEPPINGVGSHFYFAGGAKDGGPLMESTNIFEKEIVVGELFTRLWQGEEEWTYRIIRVLDLTAPT